MGGIDSVLAQLEKKPLEISSGENLPEMIVSLASTEAHKEIFELVCNAYDADATEVHITYRPEQDFLEIRDNGTGMIALDDDGTPDISGLRGVYRQGDSPKLIDHDGNPLEVGNRLTPVFNRVMLGKLGVGTSVLKHLSGNHKLVTRGHGIEISLDYVFEDVLRIGQQIHVEEGNVLEYDGESGTVLELRDLRFKDSRFSLNRLKKRLQAGLVPVRDDPNFVVYVNGDELGPLTFPNGRGFRVNLSGEYMGVVTGIIWHAPSIPEEVQGLHVSVHGRAYGDPRGIVREIPGLGLGANRVAGFRKSKKSGRCYSRRKIFN